MKGVFDISFVTMSVFPNIGRKSVVNFILGIP